MTNETVENLADFELPFGRLANLKSVAYDTGFGMARLTLREGRRFTVLELDAKSAQALGQALTDWAGSQSR